MGVDICLAGAPTPQKAPWPPGTQVQGRKTLNCSKTHFRSISFGWADGEVVWRVDCGDGAVKHLIQVPSNVTTFTISMPHYYGAVEHLIQVPSNVAGDSDIFKF